jgi:hypothetical protein
VKRFIEPGEEVVAGVHGHQSWLTMMLPDIVHPFFGRSAVVTNKKVYFVGPGGRKLIATYPKGEGNAKSSWWTLTLGGGEQKMWLGGGFIRRGQAREVVTAANTN